MFTLSEPLRALARRTGLGARRFSRDEEAATAVELGLIAIPFFGITFAIFETFLTFLNQQTIEQKTAEASRQIMLGNSAITKMSDFKEYFCPTTSQATSAKLPSNFDCNKLIIDVRSSASFANLNTKNDITSSANAQFSLAPPGGVNVVRVVYPLPVYFPLLSGFSASDAKVHTTGQTASPSGGYTQNIMGIAIFRTEPQ